MDDGYLVSLIVAVGNLTSCVTGYWVQGVCSGCCPSLNSWDWACIMWSFCVFSCCLVLGGSSPASAVASPWCSSTTTY